MIKCTKGDDKMKSSKLIDIFQNGNIVIPLFFLKNYEKWNLEIKEFIFLMYLYHLGNRFPFNPHKFCEELNLDLATIMNYVDHLTEKGFIRVEVLEGDKNLKEEAVLLDGFYQKISLLVMDEVVEDKKEASDIFSFIEKEFGRTLSSIEYEIIKAWLDNNMKEEIIKEAVKEAAFNGVSNLRYIDKILYEWGKVGVESLEDVENLRKKRRKKEEKENEKDENIDMDIVDWNWFDEEE